MMVLIAAVAGIIFLMIVGYVLFGPPPGEDEETEWTIFATLLFGEMDGDG